MFLLNRLYNLGDEMVVGEWVLNPYMQYFSGETGVQCDLPCKPSDMIHFEIGSGKKE